MDPADSDIAEGGTREIVFDTETTGLDARSGDRIIELGAIELIDRLPTGRQFHTFLDPGPEFQELHEKVTEITGYTIDKVRGEPRFSDKVDDFLAFVGDSPLVAHNADFDRRFVNEELKRMGRDPIPTARFIDTLKIARETFPGSPASLDALCRRFEVSLAKRDTHGAIIDSVLLAEVYLHLRGGRERKLGLDDSAPTQLGPVTYSARQRPTPLPGLSADELSAHKDYISAQGTEMVWQKLWAREDARRG